MSQFLFYFKRCFKSTNRQFKQFTFLVTVLTLILCACCGTLSHHKLWSRKITQLYRLINVFFLKVELGTFTAHHILDDINTNFDHLPVLYIIQFFLAPFDGADPEHVFYLLLLLFHQVDFKSRPVCRVWRAWPPSRWRDGDVKKGTWRRGPYRDLAAADDALIPFLSINFVRFGHCSVSFTFKLWKFYKIIATLFQLCFLLLILKLF